MQLDLLADCHLRPDPRTLARSSNPATSHMAAGRVNEFASGQHALILAVLREHGVDGLTAHEIAGHCDLLAHAIGRRLNELERAGLIEVVSDADAKDLLRATPSGRMARVWVLA